MLQSIKQFYGNALAASDGDLGQVKDFYFDDKNWTVRYVVADTGTWLSGRQVLLSPHAFGICPGAGHALPVALTRKQIEASPAMATQKPVSRQYEEEYHRYFGWPYYWEGDGLWGGARNFPILETPPESPAAEPAGEPKHNCAYANLRSTQAVTGYHLQATDGIVGHVCDFMMDGKSWAIQQLVIKTGSRFTGREVLVPMSQIDRISYRESTIFVKLGREAVEKSPAYPLLPPAADVSAPAARVA